MVNLLLSVPGVDAAEQNHAALSRACCYGHLAVVDRLLAVLNLDATANHNQTIHEALIQATQQGHLAIVDRLLAIPGVDATGHDNQALIEAVRSGSVAVVNRLLAIPGVDATARNNQAILEAACSGHVTVLDRLLAVPGVDASANNNQAILDATIRGYADVVNRLLLVPGVVASDAIQVAIGYSMSDITEILLSNREAAQSVGLDHVSMQCPIARHFQAIRLCSDIMDNQTPRKYALGYLMVVGESDGLPVGVSELICEHVVGSRGLAMWVVQVHRRLRILLDQLLQVQTA
eukprot:TRINITY_DN9488_c0_g1_i4.p1 TRINITY_DN9488_c0_g1~~TRINITY_DN9488_c0_g1_i4.p1  ORF type:complete len:291 (+),score=34.02 TRINITY_DN9488_c0_g1_i4:195-1067(+)